MTSASIRISGRKPLDKSRFTGRRRKLLAMIATDKPSHLWISLNFRRTCAPGKLFPPRVLGARRSPGRDRHWLAGVYANKATLLESASLRSKENKRRVLMSIEFLADRRLICAEWGNAGITSRRSNHNKYQCVEVFGCFFGLVSQCDFKRSLIDLDDAEYRYCSELFASWGINACVIDTLRSKAF